MDIKVDKNIPVPSSRSKGRGLAPILRGMTDGDSFFLPLEEGQRPNSLASCVHGSARNAGCKAVIRKVSHCSTCNKDVDDSAQSTGVYCSCAISSTKTRGVKRVEVRGIRVWKVALAKIGPKGPRV